MHYTLYALAAMISFGISDFAGALYAKRNGHVNAYLLNNVLGLLFVILGLLIFPTYIKEIEINSKTLPILLTAGITNAAASYFIIRGLEKGYASVVSGIGSNFGVIVALLTGLFLTQITSAAWGLIGLSTIGVLLTGTENFKGFEKGVKDATMAMLLWGVSIFAMLIVSTEVHWINIELTSFGVGLVASYLLLWHTNKKRQKKQRPLVLDYRVIVFTAAEVLAYIMLALAASSEKLHIVGAITGSYAMVSLTLGGLILKERLRFHQISGIGLIVVSLILLNLYG